MIKITNITLAVLVKLLDSFFKRSSKLKELLEKKSIETYFYENMTKEKIEMILQTYVVVYLKSNSTFVTVSSINFSEEIFNSNLAARKDLLGIENPILLVCLYMIYKIYPEYNKYILSVLYIKRDTNFFFNQKDLDEFLLDMASIIDEKVYKKKRNRHTKDEVKANPRLGYHQPLNSVYMDETNEKRLGKKEIDHSVCPICAREFPVTVDILQIKDEKIIFLCTHENTIYRMYGRFSIPLELFGFKDKKINMTVLKSRFRQNVQPATINGRYFVQMLSLNKKTKIPLLKFLPKILISKQNIKQQLNNKKIITQEFKCPICNRDNSFVIGESDIDLQGNFKKYRNYKDLFLYENNILYLKCKHRDTKYQNYKQFYIRAPLLETLEFSVLTMASKYYGTYVNNEKVVVRTYEDGSREFLSIVNYESDDDQ